MTTQKNTDSTTPPVTQLPCAAQLFYMYDKYSLVSLDIYTKCICTIWCIVDCLPQWSQR